MVFHDVPFSASPPDQGATRQLIHDRVVSWLRENATLPVERIDFDQSLLDLGVDSLGAAAIACDLERQLHKSLSPDVIGELETINALAEYIESLPRREGKVFEAATDVRAGLGGLADRAAGREGETPELLQRYRRLNSRVRTLKAEGRYFFEPEIAAHDGAWVVVGQQRMLMFGSYDYLGLLGHSQLKSAAFGALEEFGTGHHGARLLAGTTPAHKQLEARLAEFMSAEDAILFSSGYVANLATISALIGRGDVVIGDQWNHASIVDGCRLSGAEFLEFRHNDMDSLGDLLRRTGGARTLVVVDAVYSMDGDVADLVGIVERCKRHGALLMVDEAHSLGVLGRTGRGIQEHFGLDKSAIDVKMGTLSKALGGCGGFVAGREELVTYLRHHARGYIFSGALPASQVRGASAALDVLEANPQLVAKLWGNLHRYLAGAHALGLDTANSTTPIVPLMTGDNATTLEMTRLCRGEGLFVIPVCFPAVPLDAPRLRTCVSAMHDNSEIDFALDVLGRAARATGLIRKGGSRGSGS